MLAVMNWFRAVCPAIAALGLCCVVSSTSAADYPAGPSSVPPNYSAPYRTLEPGPAVAAGNTNSTSLLVGELELRIQSRLLSALAQEHRQRAEAATRSEQAQRAKWETELAEELGNRSSNLLAQLAERPGGGPAEAAGPLSPAETDYLARLQQRLQIVQQQLAATAQEINAYALQANTNRDTIVYGDNSLALTLQALTADLRRLQAEQADLTLRTSQFWALRALIRNAQPVPPAGTNGGAVPQTGK